MAFMFNTSAAVIQVFPEEHGYAQLRNAEGGLVIWGLLLEQKEQF